MKIQYDHYTFKVRTKLLLSYLCVFICQPLLISGQTYHLEPQDKLKFSLYYKSIKPVEIHKAIFYFSNQKHNPKKDSLVCTYSSNDLFIDTIVIQPRWKFPVYGILKLECNDLDRKSNEFYYFPGMINWLVDINDTTLLVQSIKVQNFSNPYKPLVGLILIIQTVLEMVLAFMMSQMIGWSRAILVMVLTANIASFPIYMLTFNHIWIREIIVLLIKTFVMSVIGFRKIHLYKIVIFSIILSFISFGLKEILFILMRII